jgi:hypothetical protein
VGVLPKYFVLLTLQPASRGTPTLQQAILASGILARRGTGTSTSNTSFLYLSGKENQAGVTAGW